MVQAVDGKSIFTTSLKDPDKILLNQVMSVSFREN